MDTRVAGVYEILNNLNGHRYIGSAINIHHRWNEHRKRLRKGTHHSKHLQNAWKKYGEFVFSFSVLQIVEDKEDLVCVEQKFMDIKQPEYNVAKFAGNTLGCKCSEKVRMAVAEANRKRVPSEETRRKLATHKGKQFTEAHRENISVARISYFSHGGKVGNEREILQLSPYGELITKYASIAEAARTLHMPATHISRCARGKRKSSRGYIWCYAESEQS